MKKVKDKFKREGRGGAMEPGSQPLTAIPQVGDDLLNVGVNSAVPKSSYELRIIQSLRRIIRAIEIHSRKLANNYQITGPQLACLLVLLEDGPLLGSRLAKRLYLSPSTVVGIVDRLEEKGLVTRERSPSDRRQVQVSITEAGHEVATNAPSPLQDRLSEALKSLPELEQVSITLALEKVVELMEADRIDASPVLATGPIGP